jgi:hypothetical protein
MVSHYLFEATFCNSASGWEKGQGEKNVQDARRRVWHNVLAFASLGALNEWIEQRCLALWHEVQHSDDKTRTIVEVWAEERPHLMPLPSPFDGFVEHTKRVSPTCLINFERDRYSVPSPYANRPVSLRVYAERLVIVAEHARLLAQAHDRTGRTTGATTWPACNASPVPCATVPRLPNYPTPSNGCSPSCSSALVAITRWPSSWRWCCIMTMQTVLCTVELALESDGVSKQHVLNVLARLLAPALPSPVEAPAHLRLSDEPIANVNRYDALRGVDHAS